MRYFNFQLIALLLLTVCTAHAQEPISADDFSQRGISRFEKNDLDGAIADFTKAIDLNGHELEFCFYFRGIALYRRGRLDEAIADLSKAITLKQHPRFYHDRGNLLAQKGDFDGALADLNHAVEIDPKYAKAYGDRGIVRLMRGDDADAELDFKRCFELDKRLEIQLKSTVQEIKRRAVVRAEHQEPTDVQIVKFSWNETPSTIVTPLPSPAIPVSTSPVSQTGLRVLGNMEKGEAGPPARPLGQPNPLDPSASEKRRGVDHKFSALIRNTGSKTITNVQWAYFFVPLDGTETFAYLFTTKVEVPPGKEKNLHDQLTSVVIPATQGKGLSERNRALFKERVVIVRLDYADGTSWHSSGHR